PSISKTPLKGRAKAVLPCAHRATTVSSWGLCEQEGHLAIPLSPHRFVMWYGRGTRSPTMTIQAQFPDEQSVEGAFTRQPDAFLGWVTANGSSGYPATSGRYHLYVSWACPWAH